MGEDEHGYVQKNARQVKDLWDFYQQELRSKVSPKAEKPIMRIASRIVARRTDTTRVEFMEDFVTTLGRRIYLPFTPGATGTGWSFRDQMLLCVHEHQHVVQWRKKPLRFLVQYARDTRKRALFEAEAFLGEFEACEAWGWSPPDLEQRIGTLRGYGVTDEDVAAARRFLVGTFHERGGIGKRVEWTRSGQLAARWAVGGNEP